MASEREGSSVPVPDAVHGTHDTVALGGYRVLWVTRPAVLDRIAAWGAGRRARSQAGDVDRRLAVGAATAMAEIVQSASTGSPVPWERTLAADNAELARRMGVSLADASTGFEWLVRTGAIVGQGGGAQFLIPEDRWAPAPALATIAWPEVREHLSVQGGRLAPALAVLRALAERPEAIHASAIATVSAGDAAGEGGDQGGIGEAWGKTSVAHLVNATLFGRSAILDALARLEHAGVIGRRRFPGSHEGDEVQLLPSAFGRTNPGAAVAKATTHAAATSPQLAVPTSTSSIAAPVASQSVDAVQNTEQQAQEAARQLVPITIAGITVHVPAGTAVAIDVDAMGRRTIRVGTDIVIGPVS